MLKLQIKRYIQQVLLKKRWYNTSSAAFSAHYLFVKAGLRHYAAAACEPVCSCGSVRFCPSVRAAVNPSSRHWGSQQLRFNPAAACCQCQNSLSRSDAFVITALGGRAAFSRRSKCFVHTCIGAASAEDALTLTVVAASSRHMHKTWDCIMIKVKSVFIFCYPLSQWELMAKLSCLNIYLFE